MTLPCAEPAVEKESLRQEGGPCRPDRTYLIYGAVTRMKASHSPQGGTEPAVTKRDQIYAAVQMAGFTGKSAVCKAFLYTYIPRVAAASDMS